MSSEESVTPSKSIDFGFVPIESEVERVVCFENNDENPVTYRVTLMYLLNNIDRVFKVSVDKRLVSPGKVAQIRVLFKPNIVGQTFTEYYVIDDSGGNVYKLTATGKCCGPRVILNRNKILFTITKRSYDRKIACEEVQIINRSTVDTSYQWILPTSSNDGGYFQICTGRCGFIKGMESLISKFIFTGTAVGIYTTEIVCLVLNQEPLFLLVIGTVNLPGAPFQDISTHKFHTNWKRKCPYTNLMENSLNRFTEIPAATVFDRYLDFGTGSINDVTKNISQSLCVTNHRSVEGVIEWTPDPNNIFLIDPISSTVPPKESCMFTVRYRPKKDNEVYGCVLQGDYQYRCDGKRENIHHLWFRVPCTGVTWAPCTQWPTEFQCRTEITLPPTVPWRTTFTNFILVNKLDVPMLFKFLPPDITNFAIIPMCGVVQRRGWQIISVALEPKTAAEYYENWQLTINMSQHVRICLIGNAEESHVEVMSHGYDPSSHATLEFEPTITGSTNHITSYLHNHTRMNIHMRIINTAPWLGADNYGSIVLPPREVVRYRWWFYPNIADKVYSSRVTCSCVCLIDDRPVGETAEIFIHISGYSELPDLRVLPKTINLHDIVVGEKVPFLFTLYNNGICHFTSKLFYTLEGMDGDHSKDMIELINDLNSLKGSNHCDIQGSVEPNSAGSRQININYSVLYNDEEGQLRDIMPIEKSICHIWYDGCYPTLQVKRTISVQCPIILANHCVWNTLNIDTLNKALNEVRPNQPLSVNIYAPDLCVGSPQVEIIFILGCVHLIPVSWSVPRVKICDCDMEEVKLGISTYTMRHTCIHRELVELKPTDGVTSPNSPSPLYLYFNYGLEGLNTLRFKITMPKERMIYLNIHIRSHPTNRGILMPLRRPILNPEFLVDLDCGRVPINNLDPVIRIAWLYNPTEMFTSWRLLRGSSADQKAQVRCLLYFAEVAPLGRLAIPFAFMPTEMITYEFVFLCSFGYETVKILVRGEGGLPNCIETRLDIPKYVEKNIRNAYRNNVVYLATEHITIPVLPTYSLSREIFAINNDTEHLMRFIWLPERIANIVNIVLTPWWGVIQPKSTEWVTMTIYTLQEPATFTTTVACEILDLTSHRRYQRNELLRRNKIEKCAQEFIITEEGMSYPDINDTPPYVLDLAKPEPNYLAMTVSISSKGQRDGYNRMNIRQIWEQIPAYDLQCTVISNETYMNVNNLTIPDIIHVIDGILWDALHSKQFKYQLQYYNKEHVPKFSQLIKAINDKPKAELCKRITSGICDAIVNKAVFDVYGLNQKTSDVTILEL